MWQGPAVHQNATAAGEAAVGTSLRWILPNLCEPQNRDAAGGIEAGLPGD